jgi:hypothetical protein
MDRDITYAWNVYQSMNKLNLTTFNYPHHIFLKYNTISNTIKTKL